MQHRQNLVELHRHLRVQHPADIAVILDSLPADDRLLVFRQLEPEQAGAALVEGSEAVRASLIEELNRDELVRALRTLDADDLAFLSGELPGDVLEEVSESLAARDRSWLKDASDYDESSVGRLMTQDVVAVRETQTVAEVLEHLRTLTEIPDQTDRLFVVDTRQIVRGAVPLHTLVRSDPATTIKDVTVVDIATFTPGAPAAHAAKAFEKYDLVSAPVVDDRGKLVGRITIDRVIDFLRDSSEQQALTRAGLRGSEDLFASVRQSVHNRWPWLCLNLVTAFIASRVISQFEDTIASVVALAALMPIVASIGGQHGQSDRRAGHPCPGVGPAPRAARAIGAQGTDRQSGQWIDVGSRHGAARFRGLSRRGAGRRDDDGRRPQPDRRGGHRYRRAIGPSSGRAGSRAGGERRAHLRHRQHGVLPVSRAGAGTAAVTGAWCPGQRELGLIR